MAEVKITVTAKDDASKELEKVSKSLGEIDDSAEDAALGGKGMGVDWTLALMGINQGLELAAKLMEAFKKAFEFTYEAAQLVQTQEAFESLLGTVGEGPGVINEWRDAVGGTVSDLDLMIGFQTLAAGASTELTKAFITNNAELLEISKAASALNPHLGDTAEMYESISRGIKRSSPLILDNLGIVVKVGEANEKMAEALGKNVGELTAQEKQMALLNEVLAAGGTLVDQLGGSVDSATDPWDRFTAAMENNKGAVMKNVNELGVMPKILDSIAESTTLALRENEILDAALEAGIITKKEWQKESAGMARTGHLSEEMFKFLTEEVEEYNEKQAFATNMAAGYAAQAALTAGATRDEADAMEGLGTAISEIPEAPEIVIDADTAAAIAAIEGLQTKLEDDLGKAYDVLINAQVKWKDSVAEDLKQGLIDAGQEGDDLVASLEAIDAIFQTQLAEEYKFDVEYDLQIDELLQKLLEDPESFAADAQAFVDYFMPLEASVAAAQEKVGELQADLDEVAKEYEALIEYSTVGEAIVGVQDLQSWLDGIIGDYWANVYYELNDPSGLHGMELSDQTATYTINYVTTGAGGGNDAAGGPVYAAGGLPIHAAAGYWVGEAGPEPFFPAVDGRIISNTQALQALRESGSEKPMVVNVTINTPINMADRVWVEQELAPYIRDGIQKAAIRG